MRLLSLCMLVAVCLFSKIAAVAQAQQEPLPHSAISAARFDQICALALATAPISRLNGPGEAASVLLSNVTSEVGRPSPMDLYCAANAWCALNLPAGRGHLYTGDARNFGPQEYYNLLQQGFRLNRLQAAALQAQVLTQIGLPSQVVIGEFRGDTMPSSWVLTEAGDRLLRSDLAICPPVSRSWRLASDQMQLSDDLESVLAFLYKHLPVSNSEQLPDHQSRLQGLAEPMARFEWIDWNDAKVRLIDKVRRGEGEPLFLLHPPPPVTLPKPPEPRRDFATPATVTPAPKMRPVPERGHAKRVPLAPNRPLLTSETRASLLLGCRAVGLGTLTHMADYLQQYSGSRTSILNYIVLDRDDVGSVLSYLRTQAEMQEYGDRDFWPQLPLETHELTLAAFRRALSQPDSQVSRNVRALAREIANYRDANKWFFIRPFCEMNDGTLNNPWEFGNINRSNSPEDMAAAWKLLRETFNSEGATNAIFVFSPLAAYSVHHEAEVLQSLKLIPRGYIDAFGLNVYSRPMTAYGGKSEDPISFQTLVDPWVKLLERSPHYGIPLAVPEMAVSSQASDARRADWLKNAFAYIRQHRFVMVTYFNYPHQYWQVDDGTLAGEALRTGIEGAIVSAENSNSGVGSASAESAHRPQSPPSSKISGIKPPSNPKDKSGMVFVRLCGDSHQFAHSGCETFTVVKMNPDVARRLARCSLHKPIPGERN